MKFKTRILIFLFLLLKSANIFAQQEIDLTDSSIDYDVGNSVSYFEDATNKLSYAQISAPAMESKFISSVKDVLFFGISDKAHWIKIKIKNSARRTDWFLVSGFVQNGLLELYDENTRDTTAVYRTGFNYPFHQRPVAACGFALPIKFSDDTVHTLFLKVVSNRTKIISLHVMTSKKFFNVESYDNIGYGIYFGVLIGLLLYNLFLYFSLRDRAYLYYCFSILSTLVLFSTISGKMIEFIIPNHPHLNRLLIESGSVMLSISTALFARKFLRVREFSVWLNRALNTLMVVACIGFVMIFTVDLKIVQGVLYNLLSVQVLVLLACGIVSWKKKNGYAGYYVIAWLGYMIGGMFTMMRDQGMLPFDFVTTHGVEFGSALEVILLSMALGKRYQQYKKEKEDATRRALQIQQEANETLEQKVTERTTELQQTLENLKSTQEQLIQSEKMASLGQLTAGIAHEINNPLNFVSNFSQINFELMDELREAKDDTERDEILKMLKENSERINLHSKRADGIVRNMLVHSFEHSGEKVIVDINKVVEEYLSIAKHAMHAKHPDFNCSIEKQFDKSLPRSAIYPHEIGRVILNLITNAIDSVYTKNKLNKNFLPKILVSTSRNSTSLLITIADNGNGVEENIQQKIFEPFFTTKPIGEGNGLGLSIAYEIVKSHAGKIFLKSNPNDSTTFTVEIPLII